MTHALPVWLRPLDVAERSTAAVLRLLRLIAAAGLVLVAATWRMWTPQTVFPQIPLASFAVDWPTTTVAHRSGHVWPLALHCSYIRARARAGRDRESGVTLLYTTTGCDYCDDM